MRPIWGSPTWKSDLSSKYTLSMVPPVVTMSRWSMPGILCSQRLAQWIEQAAVGGGARGVPPQRLPDLGRAGGAHAAPGAVELEAGRVERQAAGGEQGADRGLRIGQQRLVAEQVDARRVARAPGVHRPLATAQAGAQVGEGAGEVRLRHELLAVAGPRGFQRVAADVEHGGP